MSDCSTNAMSAPKPLEGQINWCGDHMPTPLNYARYVDSVERVAESIELDDVLFVPVVRCRDCVWARPDHSDHDYRGEYCCNMWIADVSADGFCWRGMRKERGDD